MPDSPLYTVGDTARDLTGTCNADLTDIQSLTVHVQRPRGHDPINRAGQVVDAATGKWRLIWDDDDLVVAGWYEVEVRVVFALGQEQTFAQDDDGQACGFDVRAAFV